MDSFAFGSFVRSGSKKRIDVGDRLWALDALSLLFHTGKQIKRNFNSCYKLLYNDEINVTTHASNLFTPKFTETIDYIWITSNLIPVSTSPIVTREEINKLDFMPNKLEPTDHFYLSVKLI